jgi:hypothetical protein
MKTLAVALAVGLVTASSSTAAFIVTSANIKNGTIQLVDLSPRARAALKGQRGPRGLQGVQRLVRVSDFESISSGHEGTVVANCPSGMTPISGGGGFIGEVSGPKSKLSISARTGTGRGWFVRGEAVSSQILLAEVYCSPNVGVD